MAAVIVVCFERHLYSAAFCIIIGIDRHLIVVYGLMFRLCFTPVTSNGHHPCNVVISLQTPPVCLSIAN